MSDLTEFLLARIAEDEAMAKAAVWDELDYEWEVAELYGALQVQSVEASGTPGYEHHLAITCDREGLSDSIVSRAAGEHIARHDPARVLADVEAKRRIVARCSAVDYAMPSTHLAHGILAELALPFADHPDYREEWKP